LSERRADPLVTGSGPTAAFEVRASRRTQVRIGPGALFDLVEALAGRRGQVVADTHALKLHGGLLPAELHERAIAVPRGEDVKTWAQLGALLERLAAAALDREAVLVAFGGGATSDAVGLAAALYHRGIPWIACPTTLLAQVDAAIGGKTAVDLAAAKNLVGAFHAPEWVLADPRPLATLTPTERTSGLGEVLKVALALDPDLFAALERGATDALEGPAEGLCALVEPCARAKGRLVEVDEHDTGAREALNLGHTLGHAIETAAGHGRVPHGVAVAAGIGFALELAAEHGGIAPGLHARVASVARRLGLPAGLGDLESALGERLDDEALLGALARDKKARDGRPRFVLPRALGRVEIGVAVAPRDVERVLARRSPAP